MEFFKNKNGKKLLSENPLSMKSMNIYPSGRILLNKTTLQNRILRTDEGRFKMDGNIQPLLAKLEDNWSKISSRFRICIFLNYLHLLSRILFRVEWN